MFRNTPSFIIRAGLAMILPIPDSPVFQDAQFKADCPSRYLFIRASGKLHREN